MLFVETVRLQAVEKVQQSNNVLAEGRDERTRIDEYSKIDELQVDTEMINDDDDDDDDDIG